MAGYGKLAPYLWNDQKFRTLTPFQKLIFLYLLSNPYRNLIGLYFLDPRHASQDLDMPLQDFLSDIRSVCNTGMTDFDEEHNLVLIRNKLKHDPITNPNQKKAALALFKTIIVQSHNSLLCKTFLESNRYALNELYDPMLESWDLSPWGSPLPRPSESTSESPSLSGFESTGKVRKGKDRVSSSFSLEGGVGETKEKGPTPKDLMDLFCRSRGEGFGAEVKRRIMIGTYALSAGYYDAYYLKALKIRRLIRNDFDAAFSQCDVILGPTSPTTAFRIGEKTDDPVTMYLSDIYTIAVNLAGLPGMSIPCGFADGLPVGLQIVGRHFDEARMLNVAHQYQQATDWHTRLPAQFA